MAYTAAFEPKVIRTYPRNLAKDIPNNAKITVDFNTDLDRDYVDQHFHVYDADGARIKGTTTYNERSIVFTPDKPFASLQTVRVKIIGDDLSGKDIGIRSVLAERMRGDFHISFTILATPLLAAPVLLSPIDQSVIRRDPTFKWERVTNAHHYQMQVSVSNTFNPILWPEKPTEHKVYDSTEPLDPGIEFEDGMYYWRMRAVKQDGTEGEWSQVFIFNKDTQVEGKVSEEDVVPDLPFFEQDEEDFIEILAVFPEDAFSNVALNLKTIYVHVLGEFTKEQVQDTFSVIGEMVDGDDSVVELVHGEVEGVTDVIPQGDGTTIITFTMEPVEVEVTT